MIILGPCFVFAYQILDKNTELFELLIAQHNKHFQNKAGNTIESTFLTYNWSIIFHRTIDSNSEQWVKISWKWDSNISTAGRGDDHVFDWGDDHVAMRKYWTGEECCPRYYCFPRDCFHFLLATVKSTILSLL